MANNFTEQTTDKAKLVPGNGGTTLEQALLASVQDVLYHCNLAIGCLSIVVCALSAWLYCNQTSTSNSSAYYLVALNIGDGVHSLGKTTSTLLHYVIPSSSMEFYIVAYYLSAFIATCFRRTAICMNALTSLDRFLAIAFPLRARGRGGKRGAVAVVGLVFFFVVLAHVYMLVEFRVAKIGEGVWTILPTSTKMGSPGAFDVIKNVTRFLCFYFPLLVSLALNVALLVSLHLHGQRMNAVRTSVGKNLASEESRHKSMTVTTIGHLSSEESSDKVVRSNAHRPDPKELPTPEGDEANEPASNSMKQKREASRCKQNDDKKGKVESERTKLILAMTFSFFFMALPRTSVAIAKGLRPEFHGFGEERSWYLLCSAIGDGLVFATDIVLFLVSFVYSAQFRKHIKRFVTSLMPFTTSSPSSSSSQKRSSYVNTAITST